eukprot:tig00021073_g18017.t1
MAVVDGMAHCLFKDADGTLTGAAGGTVISGHSSSQFLPWMEDELAAAAAKNMANQIDTFVNTPGSSKPTFIPPSNSTPAISDGIGANFLDERAKTMYVVITGGNIKVLLRQVPVIKLSVSVDMSVDDFLNSDTTTFVTTLASILGIDPKRIKFSKAVAGTNRRHLLQGESTQLEITILPEGYTTEITLKNTTSTASETANATESGSATTSMRTCNATEIATGLAGKECAWKECNSTDIANGLAGKECKLKECTATEVSQGLADKSCEMRECTPGDLQNGAHGSECETADEKLYKKQKALADLVANKTAEGTLVKELAAATVRTMGLRFTHLDLITDAEPEPVAQPQRSANRDAEPEPVAQPVADGDAEPEPVAQPVADRDAEPEPVAQPQRFADRDAEPEPVAQPQRSADGDAEPESVAQPQRSANRDAEPESVAQPQRSANRDAEPEPVADGDAEPEPVAQPQRFANRDAEPEPVAQPEPVADGDAEPEPVAYANANAVRGRCCDTEPDSNPEPEPKRAQCQGFLQRNSEESVAADIARSINANSDSVEVTGMRCGTRRLRRRLSQATPILIDLLLTSSTTGTGGSASGSAFTAPTALLENIQKLVASKGLAIDGMVAQSVTNVVVTGSSSTPQTVTSSTAPPPAAGGSAPNSVGLIVGVCAGVGGAAVIAVAAFLFVSSNRKHRAMSVSALPRSSARHDRSHVHENRVEVAVVQHDGSDFDTRPRPRAVTVHQLEPASDAPRLSEFEEGNPSGSVVKNTAEVHAHPASSRMKHRRGSAKLDDPIRVIA